MALFLASDKSSYVNGQAIPVDGGCLHAPSAALTDRAPVVRFPAPQHRRPLSRPQAAKNNTTSQAEIAPTQQTKK